jgi:hypothetical protein
MIKEFVHFPQFNSIQLEIIMMLTGAAFIAMSIATIIVMIVSKF